MLNILGKITLLLVLMLQLSCRSGVSSSLPDESTVISLLTSKKWILSTIVYSRDFDINCNGKYTNSPKVDCNIRNVLELNSNFTYTEKRSGGICIFPLADEFGSWAYKEPELCIGSRCYSVIKINSSELILKQNFDYHYDCHSQSSITHSTVYTYY